MTRKEVQEITIRSLKREIEKNGPDRTFVEAPMKCNRIPRWTIAEALTAAEMDEDLPESGGINPVTDMERFIEYMEERGESWKDILDI